MEGRHQLDSDDMEIIDNMKEILSEGISKLRDRGVRTTNIELELNQHIKKCIKND